MISVEIKVRGFEGSWVLASVFTASLTDRFNKVLRVLKVLRFAECADKDLHIM